MSSAPKATGMNRRQFLAMTAAAVAATSCNSVESGGGSAVGRERMISAGPAADYTADGVYSRFRDEGFFVGHQGNFLRCPPSAPIANASSSPNRTVPFISHRPRR